MSTRLVGIVVGAALIVASVMLGVGYSETAERVDELRAQSASNAAAAADNARAAEALAAQVRSLGRTPVVEPSRLPEPRQGRRGPGPTQAQIAAAVAAYCADGGCRGPAGDRGATGAEGARGPPGGTCPDGQTRQAYTYPDGREGSRCVAPPPGPGEQPPPDPPPPGDDGPLPGG